jgi:hypothetical protein
MAKKLINVIFCSILYLSVNSQTDVDVSLKEINGYILANHYIDNISYTGNQVLYYDKQIKSLYLPKLFVNGTLPDYNKSIEKITLPTGDDSFINRSQIYSSIGLNILQTDPFFGGEFYVNSNLTRINLLNNNANSFLSTPFRIGYTQNSFFYNRVKWEKRILIERKQVEYQKLIFQKNEYIKQVYVEIIEYIKVSKRLQIINFELNQIRDLHDIEVNRQKLGHTDITDLAILNLKIAKLEIDSSSTDEKMNFLLIHLKNRVNTKMLQSSFSQSILIPQLIDTAYFNQKIKNNIDFLNKKLEKLTTENELVEFKSRYLPKIDIAFTYGLSNNSNDFNNLYSGLQGQQLFSININLPITSYGVKNAGVQYKNDKIESLKFQIAELFDSKSRQYKKLIMQYHIGINTRNERLKIIDSYKELNLRLNNQFKMGITSFIELQNSYLEYSDYLFSLYNLELELFAAYIEICVITNVDIYNYFNEEF